MDTLPMTANQTIALMRYNARRCALSRSRPKLCRCSCCGQFHGVTHPGIWLDAQAQLIRDNAARHGQEQLPGMTT
jgi:hypothetical protein